MNKSDHLISELKKAGIITSDKFCETKAKLIIREYFTQVHKEAVLATIIATNKQKYIEPNFFD